MISTLLLTTISTIFSFVSHKFRVYVSSIPQSYTKLHKLKGRTFHEGPKNDGEHLKVWVANHIDKMNERGISVSGPNLAIAIAMNHPEFKDRNHIKILDWVYRFLYTSPYSVR